MRFRSVSRRIYAQFRSVFLHNLRTISFWRESFFISSSIRALSCTVVSILSHLPFLQASSFCCLWCVCAHSRGVQVFWCEKEIWESSWENLGRKLFEFCSVCCGRGWGDFINNGCDGEKWDCKLGSRLCYVEEYLLQNSFFFFLFFNCFSRPAGDATFVRLEAATRFSIPNLCSEEEETAVVVCCRCWVCCPDSYELFFQQCGRWRRSEGEEEEGRRIFCFRFETHRVVRW